MSIDATVEHHRVRETSLLQRYIAILEQQYAAIDTQNVDRIDHSIRIERQILDDLEALAKVALPGMQPGTRPKDQSELLTYAKTLQMRNRELLAQRSAELARRIGELRIPPQRRRVYSGGRSGGGMIDVTL